MAKANSISRTRLVQRLHNVGSREMAKVFINFTNHTSAKWSNKQFNAAKNFNNRLSWAGREENIILDVKFPNVDPRLDAHGVESLALDYVKYIIKHWAEGDNSLTGILIQGEATFVHSFVNLFYEENIFVPCLCACSERVSVEKIDDEGNTKKVSEFSFVKFREYNVK